MSSISSIRTCRTTRIVRRHSQLRYSVNKERVDELEPVIEGFESQSLLQHRVTDQRAERSTAREKGPRSPGVHHRKSTSVKSTGRQKDKEQDAQQKATDGPRRESLLIEVFRQELDQELGALENYMEQLRRDEDAGGFISRGNLKRLRKLTKEGRRIRAELSLLMPSDDEVSERPGGPRWCWSLYLIGATVVLGIESLMPRASTWVLRQ